MTPTPSHVAKPNLVYKSKMLYLKQTQNRSHQVLLCKRFPKLLLCNMLQIGFLKATSE